MASITTYSSILDSGNVTISDTGAFIDVGPSITVTLVEGQTVEISSTLTILAPSSTRIAFIARLWTGSAVLKQTYLNDFSTPSNHRASLQLEWVGVVGSDIAAGEYTFKLQGRSVNSSSHDVGGTGDFFAKLFVKVYE